jgi:hypothetical protein
LSAAATVADGTDVGRERQNHHRGKDDDTVSECDAVRQSVEGLHADFLERMRPDARRGIYQTKVSMTPSYRSAAHAAGVNPHRSPITRRARGRTSVGSDDPGVQNLSARGSQNASARPIRAKICLISFESGRGVWTQTVRMPRLRRLPELVKRRGGPPRVLASCALLVQRVVRPEEQHRTSREHNVVPPFCRWNSAVEQPSRSGGPSAVSCSTSGSSVCSQRESTSTCAIPGS